MKSKMIVIVFLFVICCLAGEASAEDTGVPQVNPTSPSVADNAYLTSPGYFEIEIGALLQENFYSLPTLIKFAINDRVELGVPISGVAEYNQAQKKWDFGNPGFQVKSQWLQNKWFTFSSVGRVDWLENNDFLYNLYGVSSFKFKPVGIDIFGGSYLTPQSGNQFDHVFQYAVAAYPIWDCPFGFFVEVFGEKSGATIPVSLDAGVSYSLDNKTVLDTSVAVGLNNDAQNWTVQFGITRTIGKVLSTPTSFINQN